jgi:pilus assembly protein Flp/PilA
MTPFTIVRNAARWAAARLDVRTDRGASAVEYGLMVFLIAAVIIVAVVMLGSQTSTSFSCTAATVQTKTKIAGCG